METKQRILVAKEETEYGTDSSPAGANAVNARNIQINYTADLLDRDLHRQDYSPAAPVVGKRSVEVSFECDLSGSGSQGVAPEIGDLLEACAFTETKNAGSSIIYTPNSQAIKSITIKVYDPYSATHSKIHSITGARGNVVFDFSAGQMGKASFSFKGKYNTPTDDTTVTPTYSTTTPPVVSSGALVLNSVSTLVVQNVNVDMSNQIAEIDDISSANGVQSIRIVGRTPSGTLNPEAVSVAGYNWYADWIASEQRALAFNLGSANYNKIAVSMPKITIDAINDGDLNGLRTTDIPFRLNRNAGNDEISLTFA
jgi:hypothetical protein